MSPANSFWLEEFEICCLGKGSNTACFYSLFHNPLLLQYMRDDDVYDEDEVRQLLQTGSDEEREISTEIGYDADSESTHFDDDDEKGFERKLFCLFHFPVFEKLIALRNQRLGLEFFPNISI